MCPYGCNVLIEKMKVKEHKCYSNFETFIKILLFLMILWVLWTPISYILSQDNLFKLKVFINWTIVNIKALDYYLAKLVSAILESLLNPLISTFFSSLQYLILAFFSFILFSLSFIISALFLFVIAVLTCCFIIAIFVYVLLKF